MSVATDIKRPGISQIFLLEVTSGWWPRNWVNTSGHANTFEASTAFIGIRPAQITGVVYNGSATLTQRASVALVQANLGSWYHDGTKLYISISSGLIPSLSSIVLATVKFFFSNVPKIFNDTYYDGRVKSVPNLSLRIEAKFGGVGQVGGGPVKFLNTDRRFDALSNLNWAAGQVVIKLGTDTPRATMAYADYVTLGTWSIYDWAKDDEHFDLKLREIKSRLRKQIPYTFYDDGKTPLPLAYGVIKGAKPHQLSTYEFQVAGHEIYSLDAIRIKVDDVWKEARFESKDLVNGKFTVAYKDKDISVDFTGKKNADGTPMLNASDIVKDLLAYVGETNINTASFATARARLVGGTLNPGYPHNPEVGFLQPSAYVDKTQDVLSVIGEINNLVGSYLYSDATGQYYYGVFQPERGESLTEFTEKDLLDFSEDDSNKDLTTELLIKYEDRKQEGFGQVLTVADVRYQYTHGEPTSALDEVTIGFSRRADVKYWADRFLLMFGYPLKTFAITVPWQAILLKPGNQIRLVYPRQGIDSVLEVLEVKNDLLNGKVSLVLGDLRNYAKNRAFVVADADVLPTRFSALAGYGSGSLTWNKNWHADIKAWARQNVGYVTDAAGFADSTDPDSHMVSGIL